MTEEENKSTNMSIEHDTNPQSSPAEGPQDLAAYFRLLDEQEKKTVIPSTPIVENTPVPLNTFVSETKEPPSESERTEKNKKSELPKRFKDVEDAVSQVKEQRLELTDDEFNQKLKDLMFFDEETDTWWMVGRESDKWYKDQTDEKGTRMWVEAEPPIDIKKDEAALTPDLPKIESVDVSAVPPIVTETPTPTVRIEARQRTSTILPTEDNLVDHPVRKENLDNPPIGVDLSSNQDIQNWKAIKDLSFNHLRDRREDLLEQIATSPMDRAAGYHLTLIEARFSQLENYATQNGMFKAIDTRYAGLKASMREASRLNDQRQLQDLLRDVGAWRGKDSEKTPLMFQGMAERRVRDYKEALSGIIQEKIDGATNSDDAILALVESRADGIQKRLAQVEKLDPSNQRKAMRIILNELEKPEMTPSDSAFRGYRAALDVVLDLLAEPVQREVKARLHLQACASALKKVNTAEADKAKTEFFTAVNQIGVLTLTGEDLNVFLGDSEFGGEIEGLGVRAAFNIMQEYAARGEYAGKKSEVEKMNLKKHVIQDISTRCTISIEEAEKMYELSDNLAEALYEKPLWDYTGGGFNSQVYMSRAMYFSTWRSLDEKPPLLTIPDVHSVGTSFLRNATISENGTRKVFFADQWEHLPEKFSDRRLAALSIQTKLTPGLIEMIGKREFGDNQVAERAAFMSHAQAHTGFSSLDFTNIDFRKIQSDAYKSYVSTYVPDVITVVDLLTKTDFKATDLESDANLVKWGKQLDRVDKINTANLRFYFMGGAIKAMLDGGGTRSEVNRIAQNATDTIRTSSGEDFQFLPRKTASGKDMYEVLTKYVNRNAELQGIMNAIKIYVEKSVRIQAR